MTHRLTTQFAFLDEIDRLKGVLRATPLADGSRRENSAEHSWHLAMYAMVFADQAGPDVRLDRVLQMLLLHDIVEIDAGDVPIHVSVDLEAQARKEAAAAARIFGLLPQDIGDRFRAIWEEFEAAETPDAVFAKSLDRLQPLLQNLASGGGSWIDYDVTLDQIDTRIGAKVARGAPQLWTHVRHRIVAWYRDRSSRI